MITQDINQYLFDWLTNEKKGGQDHRYPLYVQLMRRRKGLSRRDTAVELGISREKLLAIETGMLDNTDISSEERTNLEHVLGISYKDFVEKYADLLDYINSGNRDKLCTFLSREATMSD